MANYVEYIKSGNNETWLVRDKEAHDEIDAINEKIDGAGMMKVHDVYTDIGELDNMVTPGIHYISSTATIADITANYWYLHVYGYGKAGVHCVQEMRPVDLTNGYYRLVRIKYQDNWGEWKLESYIKQMSVNIADYDYTWTKTGGGIYQADIVSLHTLGLSGKTIIGLYPGTWSMVSGVSIIQPYIVGSTLRIMATEETRPNMFNIVITYV